MRIYFHHIYEKGRCYTCRHIHGFAVFWQIGERELAAVVGAVVAWRPAFGVSARLLVCDCGQMT